MGRRVRAGLVPVYSAGRIIRYVSSELAEQMHSQGRGVACESNGVTVAVNLVPSPKAAAELRSAAFAAKRSAQSSSTEPDARRSCVVMSKAETEAYAEGRKSRTAKLGDPSKNSWQRDARVRQGLREMDAVEFARRKFSEMFKSREPEPTFS